MAGTYDFAANEEPAVNGVQIMTSIAYVPYTLAVGGGSGLKFRWSSHIASEPSGRSYIRARGPLVSWTGSFGFSKRQEDSRIYLYIPASTMPDSGDAP